MEKLDIVLQKTLTEYNKEMASRYKSLKALIPSLSGYATEKWVREQNYLTGLSVQGLSDVVLTDLQEGQVLSYINGKWVNANAKGGGIDDETLAKLVTTDTVQTITAEKTFSVAASRVARFQNSLPNGTHCYIGFWVNEVSYATSGYYNGLAFVANERGNGARIGIANDGTPQWWNNGNGDVRHTLIHSGNYSSYIGNYLPLSGGTMTGLLTANQGIDIPYAQSTDENAYKQGGDIILRHAYTGSTILSASQTSYSDATTAIYLRPQGNTNSNREIQILQTGTLKSTVATGTAPFSVASTTLCTNLNADLLDGQHSSYFINTSQLTLGGKGVAKNCNDVTFNGLNYYTSNGPSTTIGASTNDGALYSQAYDSTWVAQIAQDYRNGNLFVRGKNNNTWTSWNKIATVLDNVASATKLQTARTIWGQSFDGSGNVTGDLKNVGTIYVQGTAGSYREGIRIKPYSNWSTILLGGSDLTADSNTSANSWITGNNNGNFYINKNASSNQKTTRLWGHDNGWTIGNTAISSYTLTVGGTGYFTGYVDFVGGAGNSGSDMRFKSDIQRLPNLLSALVDIDIFSYHWNKSGERERNTFGLNANQLIAKGGVFARMVHERDDEYKTKWLDYDRVGVLALKGVQELYEIILRQDERIKELERKAV